MQEGKSSDRSNRFNYFPFKGALIRYRGREGIGIGDQDYHSILGKGIYLPPVSPFRYRRGSLTSSNTNNSVMRVHSVMRVYLRLVL